jgi:hypothetical protein
VVAIAEPGESVGVDEEPLPAATRRDSLAGEWIEDWPDRGGCSDRIEVREVRGELELSGIDCNDGEEYGYFDVVFEGRALKFKLKVKSTDRVLEYELYLRDDGELAGVVTGATEATVTWRRAQP